MYEENGGNDDEVRLGRAETEALYETALAEWDKRRSKVGDTIPVEWFYDVLGCMHPAKANSFERAEQCRQRFMIMFHGVDGFRSYILKNRKRWLKTNYSGGYEVLDPGEQTGFAQKQRRRDINKALRDEALLLTNVDFDEISPKQRQENEAAIAHNHALAKILHRRKPGFEEKKK